MSGDRVTLDLATVQHIAALARLGLTDAELERMRDQLSAVLDHISMLQEVDTSDIAPTAQVIQLENVMRADEVGPGLSRESALANAPDREGPMLRVPVVLEQGR